MSGYRAVISALIVPALVVFSIPMLMEAVARPFEKASEGGKGEHGIEECWRTALAALG